MNIREMMHISPVIPVIIVHKVEEAVLLAKALIQGGIRVLEITLRTPEALSAIKEIADNVPEAIVGVGTVIRPAQFVAAKKAGAVFAVTPGLNTQLLSAAKACEMPLLPGVMTPADIITALDADYDAMKFFPAQPAGGVKMLAALSGPFSDVAFCPTGGITPDNARDFLSLPNVPCVGGSWLCPPQLVENKQWGKITDLAQAAMKLK